MNPTWPFPAATLVAGYAVASGTGSRPLGGVVLVAGGLLCARLWRPYGRRVMWTLAGVLFAAFVLSHLLALAVGAWPSVITVAALSAWASWRLADQRALVHA